MCFVVLSNAHRPAEQKQPTLMISLSSETVVLEPDDCYPLYVTAKRYWMHNVHYDDQWTIIFLHSTSFFKEIWEPTIESLFDILHLSNKSLIVKEAWSIECPNHGYSAELNHKALQLPDFYHKCEQPSRLRFHE